MRFLAALGRSSRPLSLSNIRLVTPSSQRALTTRVGCSIGVTYLNAAINNNYTSINSAVILDKAFDAKLSDIVTAFDTIASRIPATMAKAVNANKVYFKGIHTKSGMYGIPADVISRLLITYGTEADRLSYFLTGALAALSAHSVLTDAISNGMTDALDGILEKLSSTTDTFFNFATDNGAFQDDLTKRLDVQVGAHMENIRGVILSVLEDFMAGIAVEASSNSTYGDAGLSNLAQEQLLSEALKACDTQLWYYYALMASQARLSANSVKNDNREALTSRLPLDAAYIITGEDSDAVVLFNHGSASNITDDNSAHPISDFDPNGPLSEVTLKKQEYSSQGFSAVSAFVESAVARSENSKEDQKKILESIGMTSAQMSKVIAQLFDVASNLSRGNAVSSIVNKGLKATVTSNQVVVQHYITLLTAMLGATEDGARLLVGDFLKSAAWNESLASVFYKHASVGTSLKSMDLSDKFNALTLSKDGLVSAFKAGKVEINVAKDALSLSANSDSSNSRISIMQFGNPFDDAFFRYNTTGASDKQNNEREESIIFTTSSASSNALFALVDVVNSAVGGVTQFISRGDINQLDSDTIAIANELLGPAIVNYLSDATKMRAVGRNSSLVLGNDYTISADARKSVLDLLGVIDASIAAALEVTGSCVVKGCVTRISPAIDILKGLQDINKQRAEIMNATSYYLPGDDEVDATLTDTMNKLHSVLQDVFGITVDQSLPVGQKDTSIAITVPAGVDVSTKDMLRIYSDLLGSFESKKKFSDAKRKLLGAYDRFALQKKNDKANIKMGNSTYALLWDKIKGNDYDVYSSAPIETNFANIVSSSMLLDKLKNGSTSSLTSRGPEELRMTGVMPLSYIKDKSPRQLMSLGLDSDMRMVSNMFKFVDANATQGISDKQQAVGKLLSLVTIGNDIQRYSVTGASVPSLIAVDNILNGADIFSAISPFDNIVRVGSISSSNFSFIDLKTFYGSSGDDLLYNILDAIGIYPYAKLSYSSAQVLLIYNAIRSRDYKYPLMNRIQAKQLEPGREYTYMDLLDVNVDQIRKDDGVITSHYSCNAFMWTDDRMRDVASIDIFDVGEKKPLVIADSETVDLSQVDSNVELCVEAIVDLPFGQKITHGLSEQMLLGMANKIEKIF